ncbi:hypothetical protein [Halalkalibacterium halodurans]|uniref:hypothetical protein n=1 Tax=Halalkalibacterium halodurans TaxID=86665 RepID=UPI002E1AA92E|nr:hypothetical protein [Halalkalibacterium halodurans]
MTPNAMRSFAGGILIAAGLCGAVYYFSGDQEGQAAGPSNDLTFEEMRALLEAEGYVVQTEEEWEVEVSTAANIRVEQEMEELLADQEVEEEAPEEEETTDEEEAEEGRSVVYRTILTVSPGMTSIDVGQALERASIIEKASEFSKRVEDRGLANKLKPGTFEVDSDMSLNELIDEIFDN